jgi:hypothetical protein
MEWKGGTFYFIFKKKHWNVFLTSLSNYVNGKTKQKKVGPQNKLIKKNYNIYSGFNIQSLQQKRGILRSKYHRKQQRKKFSKTRSCEPQFLANS